jgi:hypothetical protein
LGTLGCIGNRLQPSGDWTPQQPVFPPAGNGGSSCTQRRCIERRQGFNVGTERLCGRTRFDVHAESESGGTGAHGSNGPPAHHAE